MPTLESVILTRESPDNRRIAMHLPDDLRILDYPCVGTRLLTPTAKELEAWFSPLPDALVVTSRRSTEALAEHAATLRRLDPAVAVVGAATSRAVEARWGITPTWLPPEPTGRSLGRVLSDVLSRGDRVLYLRGDLTTGELASTLGDAGLLCDERVVYENVKPEIKPLDIKGLAIAAFSSPSAVTRFLEGNPEITPRVIAVAAGPTTEVALQNGRFAMVRRAAGPGPEAMAQCIQDVIGGIDEA